MFRNKKSFFKKLGIFLAILGPGIITGSVDNDAGGITTYSVADETSKVVGEITGV